MTKPASRLLTLLLLLQRQPNQPGRRYLTGTLTMGGECDNPRVNALLEATVLQFATVTEADIFINGKPQADVLSLK